MFITTILASLAFLVAFDTPVLYVLPFFLVFGFIDCVFLSANLFKVPPPPPSPTSQLAHMYPPFVPREDGATLCSEHSEKRHLMFMVLSRACCSFHR